MTQGLYTLCISEMKSIFKAITREGQGEGGRTGGGGEEDREQKNGY